VAVNVTLRDIVNYPGGTAKTVTLDITQIVPVQGDPLEGDEIWVTSATTTATASGGGAIESIYKNQMKRGYIESSGLAGTIFNIPADASVKVAIDEAAGSGVDIAMAEANNVLGVDVAAQLEANIKAEAEIGGGGAKLGNLSYLNVQVRFLNGKFIIESGTAASSFTGTGRSSVALSPPELPFTDNLRPVLGFDIATASETLAGRQLVETDLTAVYTGSAIADTLTVGSTSNLETGDAFEILDGTNSDIAIVSGTISSSVFRFTSVSGAGAGFGATYGVGSLVRKLHTVNIADPVSAIDTVDELYRFSIDSIVNQIDFSS
jgi:hypothetical protein